MIHFKYMIWLEKFRKVARECGYALAEHGSKIRDFDLVAIPWVEEGVVSPEELIKRLCDIYPDHKFMWVYENGEKIIKPHGRLAYTIFIAGGTYLDLSIMPVIKKGLLWEKDC